MICLTKADRFVVLHPAIATREEFEHEDPVTRARRVISDAGLNTLKMYLREENIDIRAGWASVYGFEPETGRPNYSADNEGLLINAGMGATAADVLERWQPYQVIDPFVFLTTGELMSLKEIAPLGSRVPGLHRPESSRVAEPDHGPPSIMADTDPTLDLRAVPIREVTRRVQS